ncbi:hypothetical protein K492DRAFT_210491 [Lichtheimia hyalospora FSU 10163]|nr:hypothetical protein K492DRAFT_210491 [Lichtheimia hyalospora FSU 10163]
MKIHVLSVKLKDGQHDDICGQIEANGDQLVHSPQEADLIMTSLKSVERITRHVPEQLECKIGHIDWVLKYGMAKEYLDACCIKIPKTKRRKLEATMESSLSEDNEKVATSLPRQIRSWDEIKALYSQRCQGPVKRSMIMSGYSRKKTASLRKEESYQTTTSQSSFEASNPRTSSFQFTTDDGTSDEDDQRYLPLVYEDHQEGDKLTTFGRYACQRPSNWNPYNREIVALFEFLEHARELQGDMINARSYRIAASVIKAYPRKIKSAAQVQRLNGIGKKTGRIIADYLRDGKVEDIDTLKNDKNFQVLETFYHIHGVGAATAREWLAKGYRSLNDVREKEHDQLCRDIRMGLKYYEDFRKKIPRAKVELIANTVNDILETDFPGSIMTICGSYRRGKLESGDVDLVITHHDQAISGSMLVKLLEILKEKEYVVDILSMGSDCQSREPDMPHTKPDQAHCVWRHKDDTVFRRVDLVVVPYDDYPISLLNWTGSSHFERSVRLYAKQVMSIKKTGYS